VSHREKKEIKVFCFFLGASAQVAPPLKNVFSLQLSVNFFLNVGGISFLKKYI
jgi:hypothetical protein